MLCGVTGYLLLRALHLEAATREGILTGVEVVQPLLIASMLFITFCKVEPRTLRPRRWHILLVSIQVATFSLLAWLRWLFPDIPGGVIMEGAMLCLICPTATAASVLTAKLGGDAAGLTAYTIIINLAAAVCVPLFVPLVHPTAGVTFLSAFVLILAKVFPLLILPFLLALGTRYYFPRLHGLVLRCRDLAFYLWACALSIALALTARSIAHTTEPLLSLVGLAVASLACCIFQFAAGRHIGRRYGCPIAAGQSLGQKNTAFAIWAGYTFMTPVSAVAGGFYSIWHNVFNSYQLYQKRKGQASV